MTIQSQTRRLVLHISEDKWNRLLEIAEDRSTNVGGSVHYAIDVLIAIDDKIEDDMAKKAFSEPFNPEDFVPWEEIEKSIDWEAPATCD